VHHIHLALRADVPIILMAAKSGPQGDYQLQISEPIYMESNPDRSLEILRNAGAVLSVAERYIRQVPQQWAMFYPVWPQLSETVPE
jgi:lauroyl/myristoyl acyltransferase